MKTVQNFNPTVITGQKSDTNFNPSIIGGGEFNKEYILQKYKGVDFRKPSAPAVYKKAVMLDRYEKGGFSTLEYESQNTADTIKRIFGGWQTAEDMDKAKPEVEKTYEKLKSFAIYNTDFGDGSVNLKDTLETYELVLENWDKQKEEYAKFKNAKEYNKAVEKNKLDNTFRIKTGVNKTTGEDEYRGLTYDEVQTKLKEFKEGSEEYEYLSTYVNFTDIAEFDKAIKNTNDENYKASLKAAKSDFNIKNLVYIDYGHYIENEDFTEKSGCNPEFAEKDSRYAYINNYNGARAKQQETDQRYDALVLDAATQAWGVTHWYDYEEIGWMSDVEIKVYNYLYAKSKDEAEKFLDKTLISRSKRHYDSTMPVLAESAENSPILSSIVSIPAQLTGAIKGLGAPNPYHVSRAEGNAANIIRQTVGDKIAKATEGWDILGVNIPSFFYSTAMSMADSGARRLVLPPDPVVQKVGSTFFAASSAYQQKELELTQAGEDEATVFWVSALSAAAEAVFEYVAIDKLFKIKGIDNVKFSVKAALKQAGVEATEEILTELANMINDTVIRGDTSELMQYYYELEKEGHSKGEIATKLGLRVGGRLLEAGAGGFASGGFYGGVRAISNYRYNNATGKIISTNGQVDSLFDTAKGLNDADVNKLLDSYENDRKGNKLSNAQIGSLFSAVYEKAQSVLNSKKSTAEQKASAATVEGSLRNMLLQKNGAINTGIDQEVLANSDILTDEERKLVNTPESELTAEQRAEKQEVLEKVMEEVVKSSQNIADAGDTSGIEILSISRKNIKRRHTTQKEQNFIKRVAKALGVKVEFTQITAELLRSYNCDFKDGDILPDGFYNRKTKTIHIGYTVYNPVTFILKHELTHFGEGTAQYKKFVEIVKKSKAFRNWLETQTRAQGKHDVKDLENAYLIKIARERGYKLQKDGVLSESDRNELHCEMIADFVGDCIFSSKKSMLKRMMSELDEKQRNIFGKHIKEFFSYLLRKLQGETKLTFEIMQFEKEFNKVLAEAKKIKKQTPTESGGDLQFSYGVNQSDIDSYVDAAYVKENTEDYKKYAEASAKLISDVSGDIDITGYSHALRDNDIRHIKNSHGEGTNEKYPVTSDDIKLIPWIVGNYDKVFVKTNSKGKPGIVYVKVASENVIYYVEAVTEEYHNEKLLVNKQMIKTGIEEIPNLYGLIDAINKKESSSQYLADLQKIREAYVQDVKENYSNNSIPDNQDTVNSKYMQESGNNSKNNLQFSFARVQDEKLISKAEAMEKRLKNEGKVADIIRIRIWNKYGIIRDSAGEWIYEIDDSEMEFFHLGNAVTENPEIMELYELENAKRLSKEKGERLNSLRKKYGYSILRSGKLSDFVKHPKLFELFPQLKDINYRVVVLKGDEKGFYDKDSNTIALDLKVLLEIQEIESGRKRIKDFKKNPYITAKKYIIHEIQHALQDLEDREPGASPEYWSKRFEREGKEKNQPDIGRISSPDDAYWQTKGEYEARVVSERLEMTEEQRHGKGSTPWLGWNETISAREKVTANSSNVSMATKTEYMSAIKDGDTKQLQEMVDNAAKAHGYSERLYHQTGADFTEFNTDNEVAGKFDWEVPTGIFLKPSNKDIGLKGKKQMELFAKAENPLHFKDRAEAREFWSGNIDGYRQAAEEVERIDNEYREKDDDAIMELQSYMRQWKKENPNADKRDIYTDTKYQKLADKESTIMDEWEAKSDKASIKAKRLINDFMAESGYDGIVIEHDADGKNRYTKSYIVFDSSQLKSAEPIVYDDKGNVIQLSERFDQNKKDIRFSVPSVDSYTEEQYNGFGWVRANNVLQANDIKYITSEIQKIVNGNSRGYVQTKYGDYIIPLGDQYNVLVYTDANAITPHIRKIIEIQSEDKVLLDSIRRDILDANSEKLQMADDYVRRIYGAENFVEYKRQNFPSFRGYNQARYERKTGGADSGSSETGNIGGNTVQQNKTTSEAGLKKPAFSMPSETRMLLDMYENGEISKAEYQTALDKYWDDTIAELGDSAWAEQVKLIKYNAKLHGRIKRQNEQLARRRSEISQEITAQREERATKQKNIEHIRKTVSRIDKMLRTNSNTKHVPEELKAEITQFVSVFVANDRSPFDKKDLRNIYLTYSDALREGAAEGTLTGLDEDVLRDLKILRDQLDGKTLRDLNYHETLLVRNIVDNFAQIIKWGNELFLAGKEYEYNEIGHRAMYELIDKKSKRENSFSKAIDSGVVYANMTPAYFFEELGGVFKTLFDDVVEAQNKWYRNVENAKTYIRQMKEKYHYSEWKNDMFEFTTEKGDKIRISREQAMLLYATAKREYGNDIQKAEHLFRGGVVIEPSPKKLKDIVKKFKASDEKGRKRIAETFSDVVDSGAHRITPQDVLKVKRWLTAEQLEYADALVDYLSKDMAALGNETSLLLYGIRKYNEDYYIPYNSAQNFLYSQPGVSNEARLKHQSFTKNTVQGANNPLVLSDFSDVCADHINRMCMYNALTIPLENMNRIFNYGISGEEVNTKNIKSEIERVYGEAAVSYIKAFIEDMNGNVRISQTDKAINRWISKFKKGAVFASASVVVQQPSSIIRAMAYIKPKYFTKTTLKFAERDYQQCVKYAPVAGIKEMGRFDTGVGAATTNWLLQETPHGIKNKVKALFSKDSTYRDDKMSYFAAKADEITWAHIWAAVKAEIADTTDLKVGSEKFFEVCGKRFTEVINYTQVYDSTLSRSQMMRSKSTGAQMLTAFMSEPTVSLNLLMNAVRKAQDGTKEGKRYAVSAVAAFVGSVALNALLKSIVTAARDDDEEETYLEKYTGEFLSNFLSDVNPLSLIPFVKDVISIFEGYTVERADMNLFSDLAQSFKTFSSDTKSGYEKFESIAGSLAAFLGLPVKNVLRDLRAVYNLCNDIFVTDKVDRAVNEEVEGYMDELSDNETYEALDEEDKEKLEKNINKTVRTVHEADQSKQDVFDELYAELRKSQKAYNKRRKELLEKGYTADEITDGVEIARIAYMKSIGVDVGNYLLYKIATSKKYADTDNSGGVTKKEKQAAVREMDIDQKIKNYFLNQHK